MNQERSPEEFKIEAIRQIVERGHPVAVVSARLRVSTHSPYKWMKEQQLPPGQRHKQLSQTEGLRRMKAELETGDRGARHLKNGRRVLCQAVRVRCAFIECHERVHGVQRLCTVMQVHPRGYYAWKKEPVSNKVRDDQRLLGLFKQAWLESGCVYGYRKLTLDMRDLGEPCGKHRVARLLRSEGIRSQTGYRRRAGGRGGKPAVVAPNHLNRQFTPEGPNQSWATDITCIHTHEGWLYLAVVLDLFSRQGSGWSMGSRIDTEPVLNALLMALWRRQPKQTVRCTQIRSVNSLAMTGKASCGTTTWSTA